MSAVHDHILLLYMFPIRMCPRTQNVLGWVLSYQRTTYEWGILNMHEARRVVFNTALIHFALLLFCCACYVRSAAQKKGFVAVRGSEAGIEERELSGGV